jgi:phage tail sheath protein FI
MPEQFLHGVEVVEIDDGQRPISTVRSSVIGLVGTADDAEDAVAASLTLGSVDANTGLVYTAATAGAAGNASDVYPRYPRSASQALAVSVAQTTVTVSLATDGTGAIVSTAAEVLVAIEASAAASALISVADLDASSGAGIVEPTAKVLPLAGGLDASLSLNTPVLVTKRTEAARFGRAGTIPAALDAIWDQAGAWVVVVRVAEGVDDDATLSNIIGDGTAGTGVHALVGAESVVHVVPRILIAPGFTDEQACMAELVGIAERLRAVIIADGPNTTAPYIEDVLESVQAYLSHLVAVGAILGGRCWADPELNTPDQIQQG